MQLREDNQETMEAWRYLGVFGNEAGMPLLLAAIGSEGVAAVADDLVLLQAAQNRRDAETRKTT